MATKQEARAALAKRFGAKQDRLDSWPAYLGNEDGTVTGSRAGYVYVRYPSTDSPAAEVIDGGVPNVAGLRVLIGPKPEDPTHIYALGVADVRAEVSSTVLYGVMQSHGRQHAWTGGDPAYIVWRQVTDLGVYLSSGLIVQIQPGRLQRGAVVVDVPLQTLDLTTSQPSTPLEGRYTLITLDAAGAIAVTDGTAVANYHTLALTDIPATPAGHFRLAAVRLYTGQTALIDSPTIGTDIVDLRWPGEGGGGTPGGNDTNVQFNDGGAFGGSDGMTWDNTNNILTLAAPSGGGTYFTGVLSGANDGTNSFGLVLLGGAASGVDTNGGLVGMFGGDGNGTGIGGDIGSTAGNGGDTGAGGNAGLRAGNGGNTSGDGGELDLSAGSATNSGDGGSIVLTIGAGAGGGVDGTIQFASQADGVLYVDSTIVKSLTSAAYTPSNVSTDRTYDANATTLDELADVLGTLIADLQAAKILG